MLIGLALARLSEYARSAANAGRAKRASCLLLVLGVFVFVCLSTFSPGNSLASPQEPARTISVIINPRNPTSALSETDVIDIFTTRRQFWAGGVRVLLVLQKPTASTTATFFERMLDKTAEELERIYTEKKYRGALATRIVTVESSTEAKALVAQEPSAIGYLWSDEVDSTVRKELEY